MGAFYIGEITNLLRSLRLVLAYRLVVGLVYCRLTPAAKLLVVLLAYLRYLDLSSCFRFFIQSVRNTR
jgi:hypothetical protein